jgi:hypothetical protein
MAAHMPSAARVPSTSHVLAVTIAMTDLGAELEHRCMGEYVHITIVLHTPSSPGVTGGCVTLAPHLCLVVWPCKFQPHLLEKYGRSINPTKFMQIYDTSILAAGGMRLSWTTTSLWP